ncbi:hypothetical protein QEN19_000532 [Hanseniaspora menglaensis]
MFKKIRSWRRGKNNDPIIESGSADSLNSSRSSSESEYMPVKLLGYDTSTKHQLLKEDMVPELRALMPGRIKLYTTWTMLYSLEQNGASLNTLYRCCKEEYENYKLKSNGFTRKGYLLIIQDMEDSIFGLFTNEPFHPLSNHKFYGNGESFLWRIENSILNKGSYTFEGFPFQNENFFVIYSTNKMMQIGGGGTKNGGAGIWIDDMLYNGGSNFCTTFNNPVMSKQGEIFKIKALEVWCIG